MCIDFSHGWVRTDDLVHLGLREAGFVAFIVSPTAIAYQVDEDVLVKLVPVGMSHAHRHQRGFGIIGIHMDNGDFKAFRHVTRKECRPVILRLSRKAELIIHNNMNGTTYCVAMQVPQVQGLGDYAFTGESCVSVNKDRQGAIYFLLRGSGMSA